VEAREIAAPNVRGSGQGQLQVLLGLEGRMKP
jgi:hypothetical protein